VAGARRGRDPRRAERGRAERAGPVQPAAAVAVALPIGPAAARSLVGALAARVRAVAHVADAARVRGAGGVLARAGIAAVLGDVARDALTGRVADHPALAARSPLRDRRPDRDVPRAGLIGARVPVLGRDVRAVGHRLRLPGTVAQDGDAVAGGIAHDR